MGANRKYNKNKKKKNKNKNVVEANRKDENPGEQETFEDQDIEEDQNLSTDLLTKRQHDEDDSDEEKPRKKKKKKPIPTEGGEKKGQKSIRQMKREKHAQRQAEAQAASKDQHKGECVTYLSQWKHDRQNWKFMKAKQAWLYKNKFSSYLLPDSSWPILLEYFESAKGNIRNLLLSDAKNIIKQMDEWTESHDNQDDNEDDEENEDEAKADSKPKKPDENVYKRARDLIQCLEE